MKVMGLDVSTRTIGMALFEEDGKLLELTHITPKIKPQPENKLEELFRKVDAFEKVLTRYMDLDVQKVVIEEPLLNSNNVYTVGTLLRFNGMISKVVDDVLGVVPEFISSYDSRAYAFPELMAIRTHDKKGEPYKEKELKTKKFDIAILSAAPADYTATPVKSKIKSDKPSLTIKLQKAPKIIDGVKKLQKGIFLVGFKAETDISKTKLIASARKKIQESDSDMIIANDIGVKYQKNRELNQVLIVDKSGKVTDSGRKNKSEISKFIRKQIEKNLA